MNLPLLLNEIINNIIISLDQNIEKEAVINVFMAKFCSVMASKQITTNSIMHDEPVPLQYYAVNLLPSGMSKNRSKSIIDLLFEWHKDSCKSANLHYYNQKQEEINQTHKDVRSREKAYKEIMEYVPELNGASSQAIYEMAEWIIENNFGSLYFFNTEFARMFTSKADYNNILDMSLNGADGIIDYTSVLSNRRKTLEKRVSMSIYFATAYEKLLEPEVNKAFIELGNTGFFRRSFLYFLNKTQSRKSQHSYSDIIQARSNLKLYREELRQIYNAVSPNTTLHFSEEANLLIRNYKKEVESSVAKEFEYNDILLPEDESYKINLLNSPWKIVKTAFLLHLLNTYNTNFSKVVTESTVQQAIDYFHMFDKFLPMFLHKQSITNRTYIKAFVLKNLNKELSKEWFLGQMRDLIYKDLDYKEWHELKKTLINCIIDDLKLESIYCKNKEDSIEFYKTNDDIDELMEL